MKASVFDRDAASEAFSDGNRSELESAAEKPPSAQQSDVPEIAVPRQSVRLAGKRHKQQRYSMFLDMSASSNFERFYDVRSLMNSLNTRAPASSANAAMQADDGTYD